jgi:hypothetical protein
MIDKRAMQPSGVTQEWEGPILAEIHATREQIAAECGYDMDRIFDYFLAREAERRAGTATANSVPGER